MPKKSRQNFNYLVNEKSLKAFFIIFEGLSLKQIKNFFFGRWEPDFKKTKKRIQENAFDNNQFHNILRLFNVLPNFAFTKSETIRQY